MTKQDAIKWLRFDIEMMKFDPTTGEEAYLDGDAENVIKAQEMAIEALNCSEEPNNSDLISRQDAIDAICEHGTDLERRGITVLAVANYKQATVDLLESLPSAQPEQQWIPCSERLPSEGENVLLCDTRFGNVAIGKLIRYNTSCCWEVDHWDCDFEDWQAWMPLPEPYRGETE